MFSYGEDLKRLVYTTNPIERLNRQLRKYTKTKSLYPTDEALMKSVYLSLKEATRKWTGRDIRLGRNILPVKHLF